MKRITDYLNNETNNINERHNNYEIDRCDASGSMKMGFMMYDEPSNTVTTIQFNKLKDFCEAYGFYYEDFMDIDKLKVGESEYDGVSTIYTRIW